MYNFFHSFFNIKFLQQLPPPQYLIYYKRFENAPEDDELEERPTDKQSNFSCVYSLI